MKTLDVELSAINDTILDLYIEPYFVEEKYNMTKFNFTWNVTSYSEDILKIKVDFFEPLSLSLYSNQDILVLHIVEKSNLFISSTLLKDLDDEYLTMKVKVKKQVLDNVAT